MPALAERTERWRYPYSPLPKQAVAHRLWAKERLFGGSAGPGKTDWLLAEVLRYVLAYRVPGLILRRTFGHLSAAQGIIERLRERIPPHVGTYNETKHVWQFRGGGSLHLGYLAADRDVGRYVGGQYGIIGWDQLEQFTEWQYRRLFHPLRVRPEAAEAMAADGVAPCMVSTANPGDIGHGWVKRRFIDPAPAGIVWQPNPSADELKPGTRLHIAALPRDNPYLTAEYWDQLRSLPEDLRRALEEGDWNVTAGTRFGRLWRPTVHVIDPELVPLPLGGTPRGLGIDYGLDAPFCALWGAWLTDGLVVVYRELYESGLTPRQQARAILEAEAPGERRPGRPLRAHLDPSCWARPPTMPKAPQGAISHPGSPPPGSIAADYVAEGVAVERANNDRLSGTARIADALRVRADGLPRVLVYSTCRNLIRTLPELPRDPRQPELYSTNGEDHAADALRYLLMGGPGAASGTPAPARRPPPPRPRSRPGEPSPAQVRKAGF